MSDTEEKLRRLLLEAMAGGSDAYQSFLKELTGHLRAFFRRRLMQAPDEVEDLVQETLLAVHNKRHTYDAAQPLTAWVHAIARYKLVDFFRRRAVSDALNEPFDESVDIFAACDTQALDAQRDVQTLLQQLPDRHRLPIQYVKLDGLSVVEAAELTGMSESAVKIGVHRGLKALAALIKGGA